MTAAYGGALALLLLVFSVAAFVGARDALYAAIAERVAGVSAQIINDVRSSGHSPFGRASPIQILADPAVLDRYAGNGVSVEVRNASGAEVSRSTDLVQRDIPASGYQTWRAPRGLGGEWGTAQTDGAQLLVQRRPIALDGATIGWLYVSEDLSEVNSTLATFAVFLAIGVSVALLVIFFASVWLARAAIAPIGEIARAASEISGSALGVRLGWSERGDELGVLAARFDEMLERLEAAFARERRFIADASHELKTPLTVINANAQMLERWADKDEALRREALDAIRAESAAMARIINAMLTLAKTESADVLPMEPVDVAATLRDVAASMRHAAEAKSLALRVERADEAWVRAEPGLLRQLIANLTENAIKFTPSGAVSLALEHEPGVARLRVSDTGSGIARDSLPHVFDRFYRADPARSRSVEGTGLGLAVVRNIVAVHHGSVAVESVEAKGTTFTVTLPALAGANDPPDDAGETGAAR